MNPFAFTILDNYRQKFNLVVSHTEDDLLGKLSADSLTDTFRRSIQIRCVCLQMWMWAQAEHLGRRYGNGGWGLADARRALSPRGALPCICLQWPQPTGAHHYASICMEMKGNHANVCSVSSNMLMVSLRFQPFTTHPNTSPLLTTLCCLPVSSPEPEQVWF